MEFLTCDGCEDDYNKYQKKLYTSFYAKVDKDLTLINQNIIKNRINNLLANKNCRPLLKISPSPLPELRVFTFYLKSTKLTTQVDHRFCLKLSHRTYFQLFSRHHIPTNSGAPLSAYKPTHNPQFLQSLWRRANARNVSFFTLYGGQFTFSTQLFTLNYLLMSYTVDSNLSQAGKRWWFADSMFCYIFADWIVLFADFKEAFISMLNIRLTPNPATAEVNATPTAPKNNLRSAKSDIDDKYAQDSKKKSYDWFAVTLAQ